MSYLFNNYTPLDIAFEKGRGCYLYANNQAYLDALSGVGVVSLGHCHPNISQVINEQATTLIHTSNCYQIPSQQKLAQKLCTLSGLDKIFFTNSGAESNEAAIKLTRLYAQEKNIKNPIILTAKQGFHGRTMAALSATGLEKVQMGFSPLLAEFIHVEFDNIAAIKKQTDNKNIVAIMLEPILGEAGVIIPEQDYLNQVRAICDEHNWLLILDEVQTGIGRTGQLFAYQYNRIKPDILSLAKGLGNGLPIGACLGGAKVCHLFTPGSHGTTFGGNPLCTSVAATVLKTIEKNNILAHVNQMSSYFLTQAQQYLSVLPQVNQIRAKGLMIGITLDKAYPEIMQKALNFHILINANGANIRLLPPLIIKPIEIDYLIQQLTKLIKSF